MKSLKGKMLAIVLMAALVISLIPAGQADAATPISTVGWSTAVNGDAQTLTLSKPAGTQEGLVLVAQITYEKGLDALPITAPAGWSQILVTNADQGGGYKDIGQALYWKAVSSNEPASYTWGFSQKVKALGAVIAYSGVDRSNPIVASAGNGGYGDSTGKNQLNAPGLTTLSNSKIVAFYGFKESADLDTPAGMTRLYQGRDNDNDYTILAAEENMAQAAATGIRTSFSWEPGSRESVESKWTAQLIALRPTAGGSTPVTPAPAPAPTPEIKVYLDNKLLTLTDKPFIDRGRTLVPMRAFFEAMGAEVYWDPQSRTAIGIQGTITIRIPIGSNAPTVNNVTKIIEVPAQIVSNRTYIPLRFVGEALGAEVSWDGVTHSINVKQ